MSIQTRRTVHAPAELVHDLLIDVAAWGSWSPHVARVEPSTGRVTSGQQLRVRPWFGPTTRMRVETVTPGAGMTWSTPGLGHVLRYEQRIASISDEACEVTFLATVDGPVGAVATRVTGPLSALGQRHRLSRLAALAELVAARTT